jgi:hypothetical protein
MKAIIIQDSDASNLLDLLKLDKFSEPHMWQNSDEWNALPANLRKYMIEKMHSKFHYTVCRWLQEQGASCVR